MTSSLEAAVAKMMELYRQGDVAGLAEMCTADAQALPPGSAIIAGRENLRAIWQRQIEGGATGARGEVLEAEELGDTGITVLDYEMLDQGDQVVYRGKAMVVWKQQAGEWKLHRQMWNANPSPA
jgi:ketosteroid isomerase-like protein